MEDLTGGGSEGTVDEDVERFVDLADVDIILATSSVEVVGAVFLSDPVEDEVVGGAEISFIFLHNCFLWWFVSYDSWLPAHVAEGASNHLCIGWERILHH